MIKIFRRLPRWLQLTGIVLLTLAVVVGYIGWDRFLRVYPEQQFDDPVERFKYGSIGAEQDAGIPYWIFYVLPRVFADKLPGPGGYASFGVAWEPGKELPIGFTKRRIGFDRVANNCAVCHTASYRTQHNASPVLVPTGPNHTLDLEAFFRFLVDCAKDPRFHPDTLMPEINLAADLDWIDRLAYRYLIIPITRKRLIEREQQFEWIYRHDFPEWGRGRDDAMNLTKYFMIRWPMDDSFGPTDMPSIWNLGKYRHELDHRMNFAGDSHDAYSVIIDSALGLMGAEPKDKDDFLGHIDWLHDYLSNKPAPNYPFEIDQAKAAHGARLFTQHCAACHTSERTGTIIPLAEIGTDRERMDTWNEKAAAEANRVVEDMDIERRGLVEAPMSGYVAQFLDGIWLRAPYLHNGSVPTLHDLLLPPAERPQQFYRGYDVYDPGRVGYVTSGAEAQRAGTLHDTSERANSAQGHDFGTALADDERWALVEYLKTL
ncbi:MAG: c-type cytochrome [Gammaproteobacteria bacterium]|nr:c-type cytochrome [Gammaproteobacteria bacterium]